MAKGGSKKGSPFERWFCVELSKWFSHGKDDNLCWRTAGSGGRATNRAKKGLKTNNHYGDIMYTDPCMKPFFDYFTVELKRGYSRHTIQDLLDPTTRGTPEYLNWIEQAKRSAEQAGSVTWMIVLKRDQRPPLVMMPESALDFIFLEKAKIPHMSFNGIDRRFVLLTLDQWFKLFTPQWIEEYVNQTKNSELSDPPESPVGLG